MAEILKGLQLEVRNSPDPRALLDLGGELETNARLRARRIGTTRSVLRVIFVNLPVTGANGRD